MPSTRSWSRSTWPTGSREPGLRARGPAPRRRAGRRAVAGPRGARRQPRPCAPSRSRAGPCGTPATDGPFRPSRSASRSGSRRPPGWRRLVRRRGGLRRRAEAWGASRPSPRPRGGAGGARLRLCLLPAGGWALVEGRGEHGDARCRPRAAEARGSSSSRLPSRFRRRRPSPATRPASVRRAGPRSPRRTTSRRSSRAGLTIGAVPRAGGDPRRRQRPRAGDERPRSRPRARPRRALGRLLGRPVGQSGSGPTLWVLAPSRPAAEEDAARVRAALAGGRLRPAGRSPAVRHRGHDRRRREAHGPDGSAATDATMSLATHDRLDAVDRARPHPSTTKGGTP